ncbi:MAG: Vitamin B12 dependent methionine synthase activation subunit [Oscillospiraceae bacterium]|nr:Vitamin B12 dependent methionine synthase activation subunit [Oscillospiraceae bacterium]
MQDLIKECEAELNAVISPAYVYKVFIIEAMTENSVKLKDCPFILRGYDIAVHLKNSQKAILLGVTIGAGVDALIRKMQIENMAKAVIIDGLAAEAIERLCDSFQTREQGSLGAYAPQKALPRFSPGYGDFPIEAQKDFQNVLNLHKAIGVSVSDTMLLTPSKSVTAVLPVNSSELFQTH